MRRKVTWFFAILISTPLMAQETDLRLYRPFTETTKQLPITTISKLIGKCNAQSILIQREDAWRCMADEKVYDPCFVQPFGSHLKALCIESPWSNKGIEMTVTIPLDNNQHEHLDMSRTYPWAVELIGGEKCHAIEEHESDDGLPVRYQCEGQSTLIGHVQRCQNTWKILQHSARGGETVEIDRAWF